jgi:hypothetical protein
VAWVWTTLTGVTALCILISMALIAVCPYSAWRVKAALLLMSLAFVLAAVLAVWGIALGIRRVWGGPVPGSEEG